MNKRRAKRIAKHKALKQWSIDVRNRDNNQCVICSRKEYLQSHHILPKNGYPEFMLEVINGVCLCPKDHKFGSRKSAHRDPMWFAEWLREHRPEQYQWIKAKLG